MSQFVVSKMDESSVRPIDGRMIKQILLPMILGVLILGGLFGVLGVVLVFLGAKGSSHLVLFRQTIETADAGISSIFLASVIVILTLRRILQSVDKFIATAMRPPALSRPLLLSFHWE